MLEVTSPKIEVHEAKTMLEKSKGKIDHLALKLASLLRYFQTDSRIATPAHFKLYNDIISDFSEEAKEMHDVIKMLSVRHDAVHPVTSELNKWLTEWQAAQSDLCVASVAQTQDNTQSEGSHLLESCLTQILLSVESLYKRHCSVQEDQTTEESVEDMISLGLVKQLKSDTEDLHMKETVTKLQRLVKALECQPDTLQELKTSLPLLEQYHAICESVLLMMTSSNRSIAKMTSVVIAVFQNLAEKGFCRPQELQEEEGGEGATSFEDGEGTGLGEGDGQKDVSDRIESEDQLESALQEGENEKAGDKDLHEEDQGIEMNEDFEGKMQDVEKNGEEDESDNDNDNDKEDHDKQMGETEKGADKLDEKLWGEDEGSEDEEEAKDQDEEDGPGEGEATESKMVAKDDNKSKKENDKEQKKKETLDEMEDTRKENEMNEDGEEYDDNFTDPYGGEGNMENEEEEEKMELPDDMNLDQGEPNEKENEGGDDMDESALEIEEKGVFPEEEKDKEEGEDKEEEAEEQFPDKGKEEETNEKESNENEDDGPGEKDDGEQDEEEKPSEEMQNDERRQGTEENNDLDEDEKNGSEDKAEASQDQDSKTPAEAAEMDTTDASKDQTKEQPKSDTGGQREEEEEKQEEQGQMGEQTEDQEGTGQSESRTREDAHQGESSALVTQASANDQNDMKKPRKPGETDENRTLGRLHVNSVDLSLCCAVHVISGHPETSTTWVAEEGAAAKQRSPWQCGV
ncbi:Midasin [Chionoecetes opilio]|uniref:Midasin n=1 Tax=Chionoecetes opilio TaxID=41210 RepID=A0A8J5CVD0_CHIOP|nr:Midasin [Chionoecetes opilio]